MLTPGTTEESKNVGHLQEPLLVEQGLSPSEDICQRRGMNTDPTNVVEPMEVEEEPEEEEWIRVSHLRCLWIQFQCVWPALLLAFDGVDSHGEFVIVVAVSSALVFFLAAFVAKGNNVREFHLRDAIPTVAWIILPLVLVGHDAVMLFVLSLVVLVVLPVLLIMVVLPLYACFGCGWFYYNCLVRPLNRYNWFKSLEDDFFEQLQEQEATEQERLEAQKESLSYLEENAQTHPRKTPVCMIVTTAVLGIWALVFLFYAGFVLISDSMVTPETVLGKWRNKPYA